MSHTSTFDESAAAAEPDRRSSSLRPEEAPTSSSSDKSRRLLTANVHALLRCLAAGCTNAQIASRSKRSEKTVRNQLTRVYAKLGVANRAAAVAVHMRMEFRRGV